MDPGADRTVLGALLAGGRSRRFGSNKAFARVGGLELVHRAAGSLAPVTGTVVLIADDAGSYSDEGFEIRPDRVPGVGALGGIATAVAWAREEELRGAVVLACDMPFVPTALLAELARRLREDNAVLPASSGPRGLEPLCAAYGVECLGAIDAAIARGDRPVISFLPDIQVELLEAGDVATFGDPETMFFNVNRPVDRTRAEQLLALGTAAAPDSEEA